MIQPGGIDMKTNLEMADKIKTVAQPNATELFDEDVVSAPPMNSSGDIYHIMSYIILLIHHEEAVPRISLTYDAGTLEEGTVMQVNRGLRFAQSLGYGEYFETPENLKKGHCFRQGKRHASLEEHLLERSRNTVGTVRCYDQKLSTTYIAASFIKDRKSTVEALRAGYAKRDPKIVSEAAQLALKNYANYWMGKINQSKTAVNQPVLILHIRYASTANANLNLPDNFLNNFAGYLEKGGFCTWFLFADDRTKSSFTGIDQHRICPFANPLKGRDSEHYNQITAIDKSLEKEIAGYDFAKLKHLELLNQLTNLQGLRGIVGNTSGTLDLASFLGHNVYNIHQFKQGKIEYQDYRVLIQMCFSSVENFVVPGSQNQTNKKEKTKIARRTIYQLQGGTDLNNILNNFSTWLANPGLFYPPTINFEEPKLDEGMFADLLWGKAYCNGQSWRLKIGYTDDVTSFVRSRFTFNQALTGVQQNVAQTQLVQLGQQTHIQALAPAQNGVIQKVHNGASPTLMLNQFNHQAGGTILKVVPGNGIVVKGGEQKRVAEEYLTTAQPLPLVPLVQTLQAGHTQQFKALPLMQSAQLPVQPQPAPVVFTNIYAVTVKQHSDQTKQVMAVKSAV